MRKTLPLFLFCCVFASSKVALAQSTLFFDDFETAVNSVWSENPSQSFPQLVTNQNRSYSGEQSAHSGTTSGREISYQAVTPVSEGQVTLSWRLFLDDVTVYDTASFFLNSGSSSSDLGFELALSDLVVLAAGSLDSSYVPGVASIAGGIWHELAIVYDFDTQQAQFVVDGKQVRVASTQLSTIESFSFRADDPQLYVDDVRLSQKIVQEPPVNSVVFGDSFESGDTANWSDTGTLSPQMTALAAQGHSGNFSVHASAETAQASILRTEFSPLSSGQVSASWWVKIDDSSLGKAISFSLGQNLSISLDSGDSTLTLVALNNNDQLFRHPLSVLESGRWYKLTIDYDFETASTIFSLDDNTLDELTIVIEPIAFFQMASADDRIYIDDIAISHTDLGPVYLAPAQIGPVTFVQQRGFNFEYTLEADTIHASWENIPEADNYRLYYNLTGFDSLESIAYLEFGTLTEAEAALPYGSHFFVVIAALKGDEILVISNTQEIEITPLSIELLSTVDFAGKMQLSWNEITRIDNYRAYYSEQPFKDTDGIDFVDLGTTTSFEFDLFRGANYYIGLTAKVPGNNESALSNIERVSYGTSSPVFPPPPPPNPDIIDAFSMWGPVDVDEFGISWGRLVIPRPHEPRIPVLDQLELSLTAGTATDTTIAANIVTIPETIRSTIDYKKYSTGGVIEYFQLAKANYYATYRRAYGFTTVSLSLGMVFGEQDIGQFINLHVTATDDSGNKYHLYTHDVFGTLSWVKDSPYGLTFLSGIATAGSKSYDGIPLPSDLAGEIQIQISYESVGLTGAVRQVVTEPFFITINAPYKKLDFAGNELPDSAATWSCVRDVEYGLVWENKTNDGGLRDFRHTYSWYNSAYAGSALYRPYLDPYKNFAQRGMVPNLGKCADTVNCDTDKFITQVNTAGLCGASDWRLPTSYELREIVQNSSVGYPWNQTKYLPYSPDAWSSTESISSGSRDWVYYDRFNSPEFIGEMRFGGAQKKRQYVSTLMSRPLGVVLVRTSK